jgi:hypothetical protein
MPYSVEKEVRPVGKALPSTEWIERLVGLFRDPRKTREEVTSCSSRIFNKINGVLKNRVWHELAKTFASSNTELRTNTNKVAEL